MPSKESSCSVSFIFHQVWYASFQKMPICGGWPNVDETFEVGDPYSASRLFVGMHEGTWVFRCTRDTVGVAYLPLAGLTIQQSTTQLCKIKASRPVPDMENSKTQKSWESGSENKSTWPVYPAGSLVFFWLQLEYSSLMVFFKKLHQRCM